jgi:hypothetical protein
MAAEERRRGQSQAPEPGAELPDLEPGFFLSAAARREVGTAIPVTTPRTVPVTVEATIELSGPDSDWVREQIEQGAHPAVSMGARVASEQPNANGDVFPASLLASMFMNREAQAQAELAGVADLIAEGADIEFDSGEFSEPVRMGRQYGMRHDAARHYSSGGGGRVVSQRGADGRFHPVGGGIQPMGPERARTAPVSPQPTYPTPRSSGTVVLPPSPPRRPVDRSRLPSAIERVAGKDFLDD